MCRNEEELLNTMKRSIEALDDAMSIQELHEIQKRFYLSYKIAIKCNFLGDYLNKLQDNFENYYKRKFSLLCIHVEVR